MVLVHVQVAVAEEVEVEAAMSREQLQHVVEEADAGADVVRALAVKVQRQFDPGFGGVAVDGTHAGTAAC